MIYVRLADDYRGYALLGLKDQEAHELVHE